TPDDELSSSDESEHEEGHLKENTPYEDVLKRDREVQAKPKAATGIQNAPIRVGKPMKDPKVGVTKPSGADKGKAPQRKARQEKVSVVKQLQGKPPAGDKEMQPKGIAQQDSSLPELELKDGKEP